MVIKNVHKILVLDQDFYTRLLKGIMIVLLGFVSIVVFWSIYHGIYLSQATKEQITFEKMLITKQNKSLTTDNSQNLAKYHLFGEKNSSDNKSGTELLVGIIGNKAIFSTEGSAEDKVYKIGEKMLDGTVLYKISSNKVTTLNNGVIKEIRIPWENVETQNSNINLPQQTGKF